MENNGEENVGVDFGLFGFVDLDDHEESCVDTTVTIDGIN
jgi:hypothetical protein